MLRLIVMRHAKSSWKNPYLPDHDRPLKKRGVSDSSKMALRLFNSTDWRPTSVYSSTATRAAQTRDLWLQSWTEHGGMVPECSFHPNLYFGGTRSFLSLMQHCEPTEIPMFIGHNPDIEELLLFLAGEHLQITTANIALLEHSAQSFGQALGGRTWSVVDVLRPRPPRS